MAENSTNGGAGAKSDWGISASAYLRRRDICPRCDAALNGKHWCATCGADLSSELTVQIRQHSDAAAAALDAREAAIGRLITLLPPSAPVAAPAAVAATATATVAAPTATVAPAREGSQISVQSVLAVAGATLLAIAAIVFTFLNPDLTNFATRTTIIGVTSGVFLLGALLLVRAKLQFSAEAIGALGMVFVALDIWAFSHSAPLSVSPWVFAGIGTAFSSLVLIAIAAIVRIRSWLWLGLLGFATVPAWFGYAVDSKWSSLVGHLAVGFVALGLHEVARLLAPRLRSGLRADRWMLTVLQLVAGVVVGIQLLVVSGSNTGYPSAALIAGIALLALLGCRNELARLWSLVAGILAGLAAIVAANQLKLGEYHWTLAVLPLAAAVVVAVVSAASRIRASGEHPRVSRLLLIVGSMITLLAAVLYAFSIAFAQLVTPYFDFVPREYGLPVASALAVTAIGMLSIWGFAPRAGLAGLRFSALVVAESLAGVALVTLAGWPGFSHPVQVTVGLCSAALLSVTLVAVRRTRRAVRIPVFVFAHVLIVQAAILAWASPLLSEIGGGSAVVALVALTVAMPRVIRPLYAGIAFAYSLIVFAHVLQLAHLSDVAILSVTAAVGSAVALGVTLVRAVPVWYWYAVLIVSAVPFVLGVGDVLLLRSGWTALSTGVTFALALTLLLSNRPGLSRYLRALAAALLVPAVAVVIIDLGAQLLTVSASPYTLPAIAIVVACVLPSTELIGAALRRRGLADEDAALARLWIEISTLLTAAIAVILALVRAAAGLDTSFYVLLIVGIGAAATGVLPRRRYGWIVAAIAWTGALWSYWGLIGVQVLEPYLLPPAIAAAIVGAISVARKLPGVTLYAVGLACAAIPSLAVLAAVGNGGQFGWRTLGLLGGTLLLVGIGAVLSGRPAESRMRVLATPTLLVALLASLAGAIQAVRVAWGLDPLWLQRHDSVTWTVLGLSLIAAILAAVAGRLLASGERVASGGWRWVYLPALAWLALGPITAVRSNWQSVWTLLILELALLVLLVATVVLARSRAVALPPVWFTWLVAWCVAVAAWSPRMLRVEAFSLPLGLALVAAGIIAMVGSPASAQKRSLNSWPNGFAGSWRLLTPGIILTFLPSIIATGTDPQTLRAILVIALALVSILIGSLRRLGAPFILGIVVLPLENITVFAAQVGHEISATSWWITLATAGLVLVVIAVTYERRTKGDRGVAARLRDLK